jgi:hypothetical protein
VPESGSGPTRPAIPTTAPEGWVVVPDTRAPGGFIYRPDPRHPMHPYNVAYRKRPRLRQQLDEDPALQDYIRDHRDRFAAAFQEFDFHKTAVLASDPTDRTKQQTIAAGAHEMTARIIGTLDRAAERLAIRDVPPASFSSTWSNTWCRRRATTTDSR